MRTLRIYSFTNLRMYYTAVLIIVIMLHITALVLNSLINFQL